MLTAPVLPRPRSPFQSLVDSRRQGKFSRSTVIFTQGERADSVYYLESGLIKLSRRMEDQREFLVRLISAGEIFGEKALLSGTHHDATAETLRESTVHEFPREEFLETCRQRSEIWSWLAELGTRRLEEAEKRLQLISFFRVEQRILMVLADLASVFDIDGIGESNVLVPLSQSELASLVGATRETTSTTLNALERRGLLRLGRRNLTILSVRTLRASVGGAAEAALVGH